MPELDIRDTCMDEMTARWNLLTGLTDNNYTVANNETVLSPRVLLASSLNPALKLTTDHLGVQANSVPQRAPKPVVAAAARLLQRMGWRQVSYN